MQMIDTREMFYNCYYKIVYEQVGDSVNYAFVEEGETLYIYFEASNSITDWVLNFFFAKKVYKEFKVHRGFYRCYEQVRDIILNKVSNTKYKEIIIIGYSHGGALVQIALEDVAWHRPDIIGNIKGYAFESPRCLKVPKKYRRRWVNLTTFRNGTDLVTHLPPRLFGFNDLGEMVKIKGDTDLVDNKMPNFIKYHYPNVVLDGLKKQCSNAQNGK